MLGSVFVVGVLVGRYDVRRVQLKLRGKVKKLTERGVGRRRVVRKLRSWVE